MTERYFNPCQEWCETLNKNVVLVARHFQYKVKVFFKINGPSGKTQNYPICVELQVRCSLHIQSFIWILNVPKLTKSTKLEYAA